MNITEEDLYKPAEILLEKQKKAHGSAPANTGNYHIGVINKLTGMVISRNKEIATLNVVIEEGCEVAGALNKENKKVHSERSWLIEQVADATIDQGHWPDWMLAAVEQAE